MIYESLPLQEIYGADREARTVMPHAVFEAERQRTLVALRQERELQGLFSKRFAENILKWAQETQGILLTPVVHSSRGAIDCGYRTEQAIRDLPMQLVLIPGAVEHGSVRSIEMDNGDSLRETKVRDGYYVAVQTGQTFEITLSQTSLIET